MKKLSPCLIIQLKFVLGLFFIHCFFFPFFAQVEDEVIREKVKVTNFEVPVRVFYKGKAVENLKKSDFKLYEGGKLQTINGFYLNRKKIAVQQYELLAKEEKNREIPPRYFVFVFSLTDYNRNLDAGIDYAFDKVLRDIDQLLVIVNKKIFFCKNLSAKGIIRRKIKMLVQEQGNFARARMTKQLKLIERQANELKHLLKADQDLQERYQHSTFASIISQKDTHIRRFLTGYYNTWDAFKREYLIPNLDEFYHYARHLEASRKEKWVINFLQVIKFPRFKVTSDSLGELSDSLDGRQYHQMNLDLNASTDFPSEDIAKLFYKVNATFHSIIIPSAKDVVSEDLRYKEISTSFENFLREISQKTGGELVNSSDLVSALQKISEKEDIYYMLTYEPADFKKPMKIKVAVKDEEYQVLYDNNIRASYIKEYLEKKGTNQQEVKINKMSFKGKKLSLVIDGFLFKKLKKKKKSSALLDVHIRVEDSRGKVLFDRSKKLSPQKKSISISITFDWLKKGKYYILADVRDELSGHSELEFVQAEL